MEYADKHIPDYLNGTPPGEWNSGVRYLQRKVAEAARKLPYAFDSVAQWEGFRDKIRAELPGLIGVPEFAPLRESLVRARIVVAKDVICERVDIFADVDYAIPAFVFTPREPTGGRLPGLVFNPGWPQDKWVASYQKLCVRLARHGFAVTLIDHAPFGETSFCYPSNHVTMMSLAMSMGNLIGISQLAMRTAETIRAGEYMRARADIDGNRVAVSGLCQGGMDTWLSAALDERFCAAAPFCSASTFALHMAEMGSYFANGDSSPFPFSILKLCDVEHLHAAIAPRPLLVRANLPDQWWPVSALDSIGAFTQKIYALYGAQDKLDVMAEVHEHDLTGPFADALEDFLVKYV